MVCTGAAERRGRGRVVEDRVWGEGEVSDDLSTEGEDKETESRTKVGIQWDGGVRRKLAARDREHKRGN